MHNISSSTILQTVVPRDSNEIPPSSAPTVVRTPALVPAATAIIRLTPEGVGSAVVPGLMVPPGPLSHGSSPNIHPSRLGVGPHLLGCPQAHTATASLAPTVIAAAMHTMSFTPPDST
ncbi:hypothetical protein A2U01_0041600, partial [Trifolium medium]|nr:hypothetical protein [Trifolium medium]